MKIINNELLYSLSIQAKENSVLRARYNFHKPEDRRLNRTLNVMEKGCVMPVEFQDNGTLTLMVLKGRIKVNLYNSEKDITDEVFLDPKLGSYGLEFSEGKWHNIEVLDDNTVVFEIKTTEKCVE